MHTVRLCFDADIDKLRLTFDPSSTQNSLAPCAFAPTLPPNYRNLEPPMMMMLIKPILIFDLIDLGRRGCAILCHIFKVPLIFKPQTV